MNKKQYLITSICIIISIISGLITKDLIMGGTILATGLLCSYFASEGKRFSYILGLINYILMGIVSFKNNLYGIFFFYIFIFSPLQIQGFITWNKNLDEENNIMCNWKFSIRIFINTNTKSTPSFYGCKFELYKPMWNNINDLKI